VVSSVLLFAAILAAMMIQQNDDGKRGSFYVKDGDEELALMTYKWSSPNVFTIEHTEVSEKLEGKGIGKQLVQRAVEFAREKGYKMIAQCSFARAIINKTPEYQDVLN
jgi:uncharacterized protein